MANDVFTDDDFRQAAEQYERAQAQKYQSEKVMGRGLKDALWAGVPKKGGLLVRLVGKPADLTNRPVDDPTRARIVNVAKVRTVQGDLKTIYYPSRTVNKNYILHKVIDAINRFDFDDAKKKIPRYEKESVYSIINKNGVTIDSPNYNFEKGWKGQEMVVMNCIPRNPEMYDVCKSHKHTMILSKNVETGVDATGAPVVYAEKGISVYSFYNPLMSNIVKFYGDWNNYDLFITRTTNLNAPYAMFNASAQPAVVEASLKPYIVTGPLSEEETSWERYDLANMFRFTTYEEIGQYLGAYILDVDKIVGTSFWPQMQKLIEEEERAKSRQPMAKAETAGQTIGKPSVSTPEQVVENTPTRRSVVSQKTLQNSTHYKGVNLVGVTILEADKIFERLNSNDPTLIASIIKKDDKYQFVYKGDIPLAECSVCGTVSPETFTSCPGCGRVFESGSTDETIPF
jgi:hypothetical protein